MTTETNTYIQEAVNLLNTSGFIQFDDVKIGQDLVGDTVVVRPLHIGHLLVSYLIGERDTYRNLEQETLNAFQKALDETFNDTDLRGLCFELDIEYENLGMQTTHSLELVEYARRHGRLADVASYCRRHRPHITWPDFPKVRPTTIIGKTELAIVISVAQPALEKAADFLIREQIDAHILLITNVPAYDHKRFLTVDQDWNQAAQDFAHTMDIVNRKFSTSSRHFFLAGPVALIFAMGCIWGTVRIGDKLYHLDRETDRYFHVLTSSQKWLSPGR